MEVLEASDKNHHEGTLTHVGPLSPEALAQIVETSVQEGIRPLCDLVHKLHASIVGDATFNPIQPIYVSEPFRAPSKDNEKARASNRENVCTPRLASAQEPESPRVAESSRANGSISQAQPPRRSVSIDSMQSLKPEVEKAKSHVATMNLAAADEEKEKQMRKEVRRVVNRKRRTSDEWRDQLPTSSRIGKWVAVLKNAVNYWDNVKEPPRSGVFFDIVISSKFESLCALVILCNTVFIAVGSDWQIQNRGNELDVLRYIDNGFLLFYCIEIAFRLAAHRCYFFVNEQMRWNCFDFTLVFISGLDFLLELLMPDQDTVGNIQAMRMFRQLKLAKILRVVRVMKVFKELSVILESFKQCFVSLFWALVMMMFTVFVFSLIILEGVLSWLTQYEDDLPPSVVDEADFHFGSAWRCMLSLYMAVAGGNDWGIYYEIVAKTGTLYEILFLFFTFFFAFALFNILTAVFVEKAMVATVPDREDTILAHRKRNLEDIQELRRLCNVLDMDGSGKLTWEEFNECMSNEIMVAYMATVGLEVHDLTLFYDVLSDYGNSEDGVDVERFIEGCMAMRGNATSMDMQKQLFQTSRLQHQLVQVEESILRKMVEIFQLRMPASATDLRQGEELIV